MWHSVESQIYPLTFHVGVFDSWEEARRHPAINKHFPGQMDEDAGRWKGVCFYNHRHVAVVFPRSKLTHNTVAHEVGHAAVYLADFVGFPVTLDASEAFSYLLGWMTGVVYDALRRDKVRVT